MKAWLPTSEACAALGCSRSSLKNWRKRMPETLWQDGAGGARLYDVEGVTAWRSTQAGPGRPRDVARLLEVEASPPAAKSLEGTLNSSSADEPPELELDPQLEATLLELLAGGGDPRQILELTNRLPEKTISRLSALGKTRKDLADAERKELDNRRARRELVALVDVEAFWGGQISIVHAAFLSLPGRLAGKAFALDTAEEIYELIERELRRVLDQFSRDLAI